METNYHNIAAILKLKNFCKYKHQKIKSFMRNV